MTVFAEWRVVEPSPIVHGIAPLAEDRGWALLCDVGVNAHLLDHHVRVVSKVDPADCSLQVMLTVDSIDCMACLVALSRI